MRKIEIAVLCLIVLVAASAGASAQMETRLPDGGAVKVDIKREAEAVVVTNQFTPVRSTLRQCSGTCFYPNATKSSSWTCSDNKNCRLECSGGTPKGAC